MRIFVLAKAQRTQRNSYGMLDLADLAAWREIIQARDFCSRKGAEVAKEFLWNAGLGGLGGLARVFNDSCARIYFLAKAQRAQRNFYGMQDLADLAAWREFLMIHARGFIFSQRRKGRKGFLLSEGLGGLGGLARDGSRKRFLFSQGRGGRKGIPMECRTWRT